MKFGVREICDVVLKAKSIQKIGDKVFYKDEPVLYFDSLKTSSLEGAATTVYAQGGRGNSRLIAWEGERTVTFTMEDALLSAESFSMLSGADLLKYSASDGETIKEHVVERTNLIEYHPGGDTDSWFTRYSTSNGIKAEGQTVDKEPDANTNYYIRVGSYGYTLGHPVAFKYNGIQYWGEAPLPTNPTNTDAQDYYCRFFGRIDDSGPGGSGNWTGHDRIFIYTSQKPYYPPVVTNQAYLDNYIYINVFKNNEYVTEPFLVWFVAQPELMDAQEFIDQTLSPSNTQLEPGHFYNPAIYNKYRLIINKIDHPNYKPPEIEKGFLKKADNWSEQNPKYVLDDDCTVLVDYYVERPSGYKLDITPDKFGGNFYLEGSTLFRSTDGEDLPAKIIIPNCKIQSNFTFNMSSSGDPSTFTFTLDAFPDYIKFDKKKEKVLVAIQIVDPNDSDELITRTDTSVNEDFMAIAAQAFRDKTWSGFEPNET